MAGPTREPMAAPVAGAAAPDFDPSAARMWSQQELEALIVDLIRSPSKQHDILAQRQHRQAVALAAQAQAAQRQIAVQGRIAAMEQRPGESWGEFEKRKAAAAAILTSALARPDGTEEQA